MSPTSAIHFSSKNNDQGLLFISLTPIGYSVLFHTHVSHALGSCETHFDGNGLKSNSSHLVTLTYAALDTI